MIHTAEITGTSVKQERDGGVSLVLSTRDTNGITHDWVVSGVTYHASNEYLNQKKWNGVRKRVERALSLLDVALVVAYPSNETERRAQIREAMSLLKECLNG